VGLLVLSAVVLSVGVFYVFGGVENSIAWVQRQLAMQSVKGGPQIVLEVDLDALRQRRHELLRQDTVTLLRSRQLNASARMSDAGVEVSTKTEDRQTILGELQRELAPRSIEIKSGSDGTIRLNLTEAGLVDIARRAADQSGEIIRRRFTALGLGVIVAGHPQPDRAGLLVQMPRNVELQRLIGLATKPGELAFRMIDSAMTPEQALAGGAPRGSEVLYGRADDGKQAYLVERRVIVTEADLTDAQPVMDQRINEPVVTFRLGTAGTRKFGQETANGVGRAMAIIIDNEVVSAPLIREPITGGSGQISGNFTVQAAHDLAVLLRSGELPARLKVVEVREAKKLPPPRPKVFDHMIVDIATPERASFWTRELGVSLPSLLVALHRVGPLLNDVREELGMARVYIYPRD
jgi:preprotein translocase subunit SecD